MIAALDASPNLNPDIAGYDNLGAYGQWQDVAGYGQVLGSEPAAGWSPYGNGTWSWEDGYGWTWVGAEPWGWAPYHYGRWYYANGYGWAWHPPAYSATPAWSPALVGFFGFGATFGGPGFGVSVGFGYPNIGWYPLHLSGRISVVSRLGLDGFGWGLRGCGCCGYGGDGTRASSMSRTSQISTTGSRMAACTERWSGTSSTERSPVTLLRSNPHRISGHVGMIHGPCRDADPR